MISQEKEENLRENMKRADHLKKSFIDLSGFYTNEKLVANVCTVRLEVNKNANLF